MLNELHGCNNLPTEEFLVHASSDLFATVDQKSARTDPHLRLDLGIGVARSPPRNTNQSCIIRIDDSQGGICGCYTSAGSGPTFRAIAGDLDGVALFVRVDQPERELRKRLRHEIKVCGERKDDGPSEEQDKVPGESEMRYINGSTLHRFLSKIASSGTMSLPRLTRDLTEARYRVQPYISSLVAFQAAQNVYQGLAGAMASLRVIDRPLHEIRWTMFLRTVDATLSRSCGFACIAFFESGVYDLDPGDLTEVIALSTRNSLYVSAVLLGDPVQTSDKVDEIRHVIGNVGKTGIVLMVAPLAPKVRRTDLAMWKRIAHSRFDGKLEDCFSATSLHLSFTEFEMPLGNGQRGSIDRDTHVRVVETIISVYDRADWVADLDVLLLYSPKLRGGEFVRRFEGQICNQAHVGMARRIPLTAVDNWEELLNLPDDMGTRHVGVVRAQANWIGRLATACVAAQRGIRTVILPMGDVCWDCCLSENWKWKPPRGEKKRGKYSDRVLHWDWVGRGRDDDSDENDGEEFPSDFEGDSSTDDAELGPKNWIGQLPGNNNSTLASKDSQVNHG